MNRSLFVLILFATVACTNNQIELANKGTSNHEIVIPADSDSTVVLAAKELKRYLQQISGADFPVCSDDNRNTERNSIFVGFGFHDHNHTAFSIGYRIDGKDLYIDGGNPKSTLYAVYRFLEQELGCLWLSPDVEKIPESKSISLKLETGYSHTPQIETRTVHSKLFYENHAFADKLGVTYEPFPGYVPGARVHTFHRFLPESSFYNTHPEYYALRNGKRLTTQLCLTNEDVLRIVIDSVRSHFNRNPNTNIISVSQDDNTLHCQCDHCTAIDEEEGSASGSMIRFVNSVAEKFPGNTISTLAYQYTRKPSVTKPASNVLITLCSIECDRSKPIEVGCTDFANDLKGWKKLTENIRIWDYTTQFTNFLAPFPNMHTLKTNIELFKNNNAKWVFEQHSHQPSELFELRSYLTAQLLWNPESDAEKIRQDFCEAYYQEAAPFVLDYISTIHEEIQKVPEFFLFLYGDPSQGLESFLRPELLDKYDLLYSMAEDAVSQKPDVLERVKRAALSSHYAILEASRKGITEKYRISPQILSRLEQFEEVCKDAGITMINETGFTVDEYINAYYKLLERVKISNMAKDRAVILLTQPKKYADENPKALTDGAFGGNSFYSNWLGFEGNDLEAIIDLEQTEEISHLQTAFLKGTNHIIFFPEQVIISYSIDNKTFHEIGRKNTEHPLKKGDKVNDIEHFSFQFPPIHARYIKLYAQNMKEAPEWHNASGSPSWIFCDEVIIH